MARQRGGIAGFYDRNKGVLQTLAPIAAGAIGGPMAGAAVGAAMRGFDRPGKSGIGFDIGQGAIGGITGYGAGKMGQALRGGISGLFAPKGAPDISQTLAKTSGMIDEANAQILSKPVFGGAPTNFVQTVGGGIPSAELDAMRQSARAASARAGILPRPDMASKIGMTGPASLPPVDMASKIGMTGPASLPPVDMASKIGMTGPSLPPMDVSRSIGMTGPAAGPSTSTDYIGNAVNRFLAQSGTAMPSASPTASLFSPATTATSLPTPLPTPMPTPGPSPTSMPSFFRSREGIAALGQGAQAAAGLIGSQRQMAMEQERMDREQREAEARAQLMAMFAPRILSGFSTGYGSMAGGG